jgi:hypothetical protein
VLSKGTCCYSPVLQNMASKRERKLLSQLNRCKGHVIYEVTAFFPLYRGMPVTRSPLPVARSTELSGPGGRGGAGFPQILNFN